MCSLTLLFLKYNSNLRYILTQCLTQNSILGVKNNLNLIVLYFNANKLFLFYDNLFCVYNS